MAKAGAQRDVKGVVHVGGKGSKKFFTQRKRQIMSLNREHFDAETDEVRLTAQEYKAKKDELTEIVDVSFPALDTSKQPVEATPKSLTPE